MKEGTIPPNWIGLVQRISQSGATEYVDIKYNWFTPDPEEDLGETPSHDSGVAPENNDKTLTSPQSVVTLVK